MFQRMVRTVFPAPPGSEWCEFGDFRMIEIPADRVVRLGPPPTEHVDRDLETAFREGFEGVKLKVVETWILERAIDLGFKVFYISGDSDPETLARLECVEGIRGLAWVDTLSCHPQLEIVRVAAARPELPDPASALRELRVVGAKELPLLNAPALQHLILDDCEIRTLDALRCCVGLRYLRVHTAPFLVDISVLSALPQLEQVCFGECPALDLSGLSGAPALERLSVLDCGAIADLGFVRGLPGLDQLETRGSKIQDHDLSPFLEGRLIYSAFDYEKHHSHTEDEIRVALEAQRAARCKTPPANPSGSTISAHIEGVGQVWFSGVDKRVLEDYNQDIAATHRSMATVGVVTYAPIITHLVEASFVRAGRLVVIEVANPHAEEDVGERIGSTMARLEQMSAQAEQAIQTEGHPEIDEYVSDHLDRFFRKRLGVKNAKQVRARIHLCRVRLNASESDLRPFLDFSVGREADVHVLACRFDGAGRLQEITQERRPGVRLF